MLALSLQVLLQNSVTHKRSGQQQRPKMTRQERTEQKDMRLKHKHDDGKTFLKTAGCQTRLGRQTNTPLLGGLRVTGLCSNWYLAPSLGPRAEHAVSIQEQ